MLKRGRRKKAALAVAVVALLALAGTFAWANYTQTALNEAKSTANQGGRLHDDFTFATAAASNKDVYVENFTSADDGGVPIYARVRFLEYMEKGTNAGDQYNRQATSVADKGVANPTLPTLDNTNTWSLHYFKAEDDKNSTGENKIHEFWDWVYGSPADGSTVYMPTFNKNKDSFQADVNGSMKDAGGPYSSYTTYTVGQTLEENASYDADSDNSNDESNGGVSLSGTKLDSVTPLPGTGGSQGVNFNINKETHTAANTLRTEKVISMAEWASYNGTTPGQEKTGPFWVYDSDGWAYWAQPIDPSTATGLLLTNISPKAIGDDWYYGIEAQAQFASYSEWTGTSDNYTFTNPSTNSGNAIDGNKMTNNAWDLLEEAKKKDSSQKPAANDTYTVSITASPDSETINAGGQMTLTASSTKKTNGEDEPDFSETYKWTVSGPATLSGDSGTSVTLTVKGDADNPYNQTIRVTVTGDDSHTSTTKAITVNPKPATPPATSGVAGVTPGSTNTVPLDVDGNDDGTNDQFYVLAKKNFTAGELGSEGCQTPGQYGLVLAKDLIASTPFDTGGSTSWSASSSRTWCNGAYFNKIGSELQSQIAQVTIKTQTAYNAAATSDTKDKVFFLSAADLYGQSWVNGQKVTASADHYTAGSQLTSNSQIITAIGGNNWYWLRSPGSASDYVAVVYSDGSLNNGNNPTYTTGAARPAFWVYLGPSA